MKILLVDDDAFLRDMYATKFEENGDSVAVAKTTHEALAMLEDKQAFDIILLDMVMPGMSGLEFLEKMGQMDLMKGSKVIVLSNQGEQSDIDNATKAGAVGYIVKAESIPSQVVSKVNELAKA